MKTLSIINNKGGVGKTTLTIGIGYEIAINKNKKVLLVDFDGQGSITKSFDIKTDMTVANLLFGSCTIDDVIRKSPYKNLDVLTSNSDLYKVAKMLKDDEAELYTILREALKEVIDRYDYCIIDNAPSIDITTYNSLVASDYIIVPAIPEKSSTIFGLTGLMNAMQISAQYNPTMNFLGLIINNFEKTPSRVEFEKSLRGQEVCPVMKNKIRHSKLVADSIDEGKAIGDYSKQSCTAVDIRKITAELLEKMEG